MRWWYNAIMHWYLFAVVTFFEGASTGYLLSLECHVFCIEVKSAFRQMERPPPAPAPPKGLSWDQKRLCDLAQRNSMGTRLENMLFWSWGVASALKCETRSLSPIATDRRSGHFVGQCLQAFWHVPRQQARLLRRLHWVLPRKDAKGTCQMLLDSMDIISDSPPSLKTKSMSKLPLWYSTANPYYLTLVAFDQSESFMPPCLCQGMRKFCTPLLTKPKPEDLQWETVQQCLGCCGRPFKICQYLRFKVSRSVDLILI